LKTVQLFLFLIISQLAVTNVFANGSCFSFLPYGYNEFFVHLPKNESFCVDTPDGVVHYETDKLGARIIKGQKFGTSISGFGESQLLEIFPNKKPNGHALKHLYGDSDIQIHGAPNNGPYETLEYLKYFLRLKIPKKIVIGFNFGTDLFRIIPGWKTKDRVLLKSDDLSKVMSFPFYYETKIAFNLFFGGSIEKTNPEGMFLKMRESYSNNLKIIEKNYKGYLETFLNFSQSKHLSMDFIIFPPFWSYQNQNGNSYLNKNIWNKFKKFVCKKRFIEKTIFENIYIVKYAEKGRTNKMFTYDLRHFLVPPTSFIKKKQFCL